MLWVRSARGSDLVLEVDLRHGEWFPLKLGVWIDRQNELRREYKQRRISGKEKD